MRKSKVRWNRLWQKWRLKWMKLRRILWLERKRLFIYKKLCKNKLKNTWKCKFSLINRWKSVDRNTDNKMKSYLIDAKDSLTK
jgi:hypothetical protein